jgi:hypothetical protein
MLLRFDLRTDGLVRDRIVRTAGARPLASFVREMFVHRAEIDEISVSQGSAVLGVFSRATSLGAPRPKSLPRIASY